MKLSDMYLVLYNSACALGWALVLFLAVPTLLPTPTLSSLASFYSLPGTESIPALATVLFFVQSAAILEVLHPMLGLVRSPVLVTAMQVSSRLVALYAIVSSTAAQTHYGAGLMILGWALVEVPRYLFYVAALFTGDATKGTPYPIFYLRYSLFSVLYPLGITGELFTFYNMAHQTAIPFLKYFYLAVIAVYVPGGPFMYLNMVGNRKSAFKKRFAKPPPPPRGLIFPTDSKGDRSTAEAGRNAIAAAVAAVDPAAAKVIRDSSTRKWRFGYVKHFLKLVEVQSKSKGDCLSVAKAGLEHLHDSFLFVDEEGETCSFKEAMSRKNKSKFHTGFVKGEGGKVEPKLRVPYKGGVLEGKKLKEKVQEWVEYGTIEQSAADAIVSCVDNPAHLDLSDKYFVMLGAGSAMGPFKVLMALGANVVAIDLDRAGIWKNLITTARNSPGSITFPLKIPEKSCADDAALFANAGCNLFTETPIIKDWLVPLYPKEDFVVGSYAYLDGALHVQVSLAMDAICAALTTSRKASLAYLCTPTDAHLCTKAAHDAARKEYNRLTLGRLFEAGWQLLSRGAFLKKNSPKPFMSDAGEELYYCNGLAVAQGPNYALAKRLQHWRAILARNAGCVVSSNIAPATSTASVVNARTFAWAYEGMPYFRPYEIFEPDTSKAVMLGLLTYDLRVAASAGNPKTALGNPNELFKNGSFNGGCWRCAYTVSSIGEVSVFVYFARVATPYLVGVTAVAIAAGAKATGLI